MKLHGLTKPSAARLHSLVQDAPTARDALLGWEAADPQRRVVRVVRGHKAVTEAAFFDEIAAALQFPLYFGENWAALDECLADLDWLRGETVVVLIVHAERLLESAPADRFTTCWQVLARAAREVAQPSAIRTARALHVVAQTGALEALTLRMHGAGVALVPLS